MKRTSIIIIAVVAVIILIIAGSGLFIMDETEQVVITRLGKPVRTILNPGLHFKIPFVETVHTFDKRFLEWRGDSNQVTTKDKRYIWVDTYARWHIVDPLLYYKRLRDERGAMSRIDDIIDGETRTAFAKHDLIELVRTSNRKPLADPVMDMDSGVLQEITYGRNTIANKILKASAGRVQDLGLEILDFKIKRINYVKEVQKTVFERMITERKRIADKYRSEGQGEASRISGEKDRELKRIQSEAKRTAQEIMGKADAKAAAIYNDAYNKNAVSRDFYTFMKTMETYEKALDSGTSIILSTESDFYKYLKSVNPE
ncbi:MAG: protease modulator HflC [Candidatus Marinimicrobia bacterium]|nr:protease modulator HflC [Candidatus Neomarinimicrobiota bacterium]